MATKPKPKPNAEPTSGESSGDPVWVPEPIRAACADYELAREAWAAARDADYPLARRQLARAERALMTLLVASKKSVVVNGWRYAANGWELHRSRWLPQRQVSQSGKPGGDDARDS